MLRTHRFILTTVSVSELLVLLVQFHQKLESLRPGFFEIVESSRVYTSSRNLNDFLFIDFVFDTCHITFAYYLFFSSCRDYLSNVIFQRIQDQLILMNSKMRFLELQRNYSRAILAKLSADQQFIASVGVNH